MVAICAAIGYFIVFLGTLLVFHVFLMANNLTTCKACGERRGDVVVGEDHVHECVAAEVWVALL